MRESERVSKMVDWLMLLMSCYSNNNNNTNHQIRYAKASKVIEFAMQRWKLVRGPNHELDECECASLFVWVCGLNGYFSASFIRFCFNYQITFLLRRNTLVICHGAEVLLVVIFDQIKWMRRIPLTSLQICLMNIGSSVSISAATIQGLIELHE